MNRETLHLNRLSKEGTTYIPSGQWPGLFNAAYSMLTSVSARIICPGISLGADEFVAVEVKLVAVLALLRDFALEEGDEVKDMHSLKLSRTSSSSSCCDEMNSLRNVSIIKHVEMLVASEATGIPHVELFHVARSLALDLHRL